jgi:lysophospholipase L1-like esterase
MNWSRFKHVKAARRRAPFGMATMAVTASGAALVSVTTMPTTAIAMPRHHTWTGAWTTSMVAASSPVFGLPNWSLDGFANQSVRQVMRVSRGGSAVRIRLSNVYGASPLAVSGASIGVAADGASVQPGTLQSLTFGHSPSTTIPAGRQTVSDAVPMRVSPLEQLTITLFFAKPTGPATLHPLAFATSYRSTGDHMLDQAAGAFGDRSLSWYYLSGIDVTGPPGRDRGAVVAFGDSITDGAMSTTDANNRYPDELAERLVAARRPMGVLNAGIGGNQVLNSLPGYGAAGLDRFRRDVLDQPQVRTLILLEGINDIAISRLPGGTPVTATQLIDAYQAMIRAAHRRGIRVIGATILPTKDAALPAYYTPEGEAVRDAVNDWTRTSGAYDAIVDLDRLFADPSDPDRMRPDYNSGDGVHPNDAGMHAIANAIDLNTL